MTGVVLAGTLLAACSNHSGLRRLHPSDGAASAVSLPSGLAGSASPSGAPTASRTPGHPATRSAGAGSTQSATTTSSTTSGPPPASATASHGTSRHTGGSSSSHHPHPSSSAPARPPRSSVPPSPSVAVSPARGLHGGQQVTVSGAYFRSGERLGVQECRTSLSTCLGLTARSATVGGGGAFRTSFVVSSTVLLTNCHQDGCVIRVRRSDGDVYVVPIAFG